MTEKQSYSKSVKGFHHILNLCSDFWSLYVKVKYWASFLAAGGGGVLILEHSKDLLREKARIIPYLSK